MIFKSQKNKEAQKPEQEQRTGNRNDLPELAGYDSIQRSNSAIKIISNILFERFAGNSDCLKDKNLNIYIADNQDYLLLSSKDFCDRLRLSIARDGFEIGDIRIMDTEAPTAATPIAKTLSIMLLDGKEEPIGKPANDEATECSPTLQAKISVYEGNGTLHKTSYKLNAEGCPYHIGRDAIGKSAIAIKGDKSDANYELNKFVRSRHAVIDHVPEHGFVFFVERDGSRTLGGNRTQIRRGNTTFEVEDPAQGIKLRDGDIIILGKSVQLLWKSIEDSTNDK